jgi:hypothetical protein
MENIGGFGLEVVIYASVTFPDGLVITQFADDADALDSPAIQISDKAMGLNGDLIVWKKAAPIIVSVNVIPGSDDDINLQVLAEANRTGRGKRPVNDVINLTASYPAGQITNLTSGTITDAVMVNSVTSAARMKTKNYAFVFENKVGA